MSTAFDTHPHTFHIPVMGTGFTIDCPLHVARYGISSVISLVDDVLIEQMRQHHSRAAGIDCVPITDDDADPRADRITAYLNLLDLLVRGQMEQLRIAPFTPESELTRYFEMLPESPLKTGYRAMMDETDPEVKGLLQDELRQRVVAGSIDVNIMTKLDCLRDLHGTKPPAIYSDAKAALRGFARSDGRSSIVCSAGMNRELYKYFADFDAFFPVDGQPPRKNIVLKVSDYRSAEFQGKFLAKYGLWVSEFRVESGLNCGGHAFATKGLLLGPILEEFVEKRTELRTKLHDIYAAALEKMGRQEPDAPFDIRLTVQGGIGTSVENDSLLTCYNVDGTGWGTPFLLVPEAVNVDPAHLELLAQAGEDDVYLSPSSPMGVPFWNLRSSASERARERRIREGAPGSACRKGYIRFNTDLTELPVCTASSHYQRKRLAVLETEQLTDEAREKTRQAIVAKSCICHDLAGCITGPLGIDPDATTAICPGPNIAHFTKIFSLREMIDHIYGRISLIDSSRRPNMFVREMRLYIDNFRSEVEKCTVETAECTMTYLTDFKANLHDGIAYYINRAETIVGEHREQFIRDIQRLHDELDGIALAPAT